MEMACMASISNCYPAILVKTHFCFCFITDCMAKKTCMIASKTLSKTENLSTKLLLARRNFFSIGFLFH